MRGGREKERKNERKKSVTGDSTHLHAHAMKSEFPGGFIITQVIVSKPSTIGFRHRHAEMISTTGIDIRRLTVWGGKEPIVVINHFHLLLKVGSRAPAVGGRRPPPRGQRRSATATKFAAAAVVTRRKATSRGDSGGGGSSANELNVFDGFAPFASWRR